MADPVSVPIEDGHADCSYCGAQGLTIAACMCFHVPTPLGEVAIALCPRHLAMMIEELSDAERQITGVRRPRPPKLAVVKR